MCKKLWNSLFIFNLYICPRNLERGKSKEGWIKRIVRKVSERPAFELSLETWKGVCLVPKLMKGNYKYMYSSMYTWKEDRGLSYQTVYRSHIYVSHVFLMTSHISNSHVSWPKLASISVDWLMWCCLWQWGEPSL